MPAWCCARCWPCEAAVGRGRAVRRGRLPGLAGARGGGLGGGRARRAAVAERRLPAEAAAGRAAAGRALGRRDRRSGRWPRPCRPLLVLPLGLDVLGAHPLLAPALAGAGAGRRGLRLAAAARAGAAAGRHHGAAGRAAVAHPPALPLQHAEHRAGAGARRPGAGRGRAGGPGRAVPRRARPTSANRSRWPRRSSWRGATSPSSRCASASG